MCFKLISGTILALVIIGVVVDVDNVFGVFVVDNVKCWTIKNTLFISKPSLMYSKHKNKDNIPFFSKNPEGYRSKYLSNI